MKLKLKSSLSNDLHDYILRSHAPTIVQRVYRFLSMALTRETTRMIPYSFKLTLEMAQQCS
jgi:hypothetical protein